MVRYTQYYYFGKVLGRGFYEVEGFKVPRNGCFVLSKLTKHNIVLGFSIQVLLIHVCREDLNVAPSTVHLLLVFHCVLNDQSLPFIAKWFESCRDGIESAILSGLQTFKQKKYS